MSPGPLSFAAGLLLCTALLACSSAPPVPPTLAPLLDSIEQRLAIADQVALSKWDSGKNIEDPAREREVIARAVANSPRYRLSEEATAAFFADQIEANKMVQHALLSKWRAAGHAPDVPRADLRTDIRPQLDQLQHHLLQQLADFSPHRRDPGCPGWLAHADRTSHSSPERAQAMIRAQKQLCIDDQ